MKQEQKIKNEIKKKLLSYLIVTPDGYKILIDPKKWHSIFNTSDHVEKVESTQVGNIPRNRYMNIHGWLRRNYGPANRCEGCGGINLNYQYALIDGKEYDYDVNNFIMLCVSCHRKYDGATYGTKSVIRFRDGVSSKTYDSIKQAAKDNNGCSGAISNCLSGRTKSAYGFKWKYNE